ncbi:MAG: hypothetical protein AB7I41_05690 [Candidatus Sericytochromatia bacterium]
MFKSKFCFALFFLSACSVSPLVLTPPKTNTSFLAFSETQSLLPEQVQDFVLQKLKKEGHKLPKTAKFTPDWYSNPPQAGLNKTPDLTITDVWLNGQSIQGPNAPSLLRPEWDGQPLELVLKGQFENKKDKDLKLKAFLFTLEPTVLLRSMAPNENEPTARILLDDAILLTPLSVSGTEIRVKLPQEGLPDLFLRGLHKLTLIKNHFYFDTQIKVGEPLAAPPTGALQPQIQSIEVVRNNKGQPRFLRCTGSGLMLMPKFSYAQVDSEFAFGYQSQIVQNEATREYETLIHIPDPDSFDLNAQHTLTYATPFGTTFKQF